MVTRKVTKTATSEAAGLWAGLTLRRLIIPGDNSTSPEYPLIQCETYAKRLNGKPWEVGGSVNLGHLLMHNPPRS